MELKEIAAVSGKEGLFKVLKPARNGVLVETLDAQKKKVAIGATGKVSLLQEISIYTNTKEGAIPLQEVFFLMLEKYNDTLPLDSKASSADLMSFLAELLPDYDTDKVYPSDVKKLIKWYQILYKEAIEVLQRPAITENDSPMEESVKEENTNSEANEDTLSKTKKTKAKKENEDTTVENVESKEKTKKTTKAKKTEDAAEVVSQEEKPKKVTKTKKQDKE
ncbi:MAG: DUF5606 domain-containing protein [Thermonemataceae bacterium]|nr:DUF5606 domain-containing protein [Thermonemataceae bacterium]